jgi:hypothetical protein
VNETSRLRENGKMPANGGKLSDGDRNVSPKTNWPSGVDTTWDGEEPSGASTFRSGSKVSDPSKFTCITL